MRQAAAFCLLLFPLQLAVVLLDERAKFLGEAQEPVPLLHVKGDRHSLQAVNADRPFLADLSIERSALRLIDLRQEFRGCLNFQFNGSKFHQDFFFVHGFAPCGVVLACPRQTGYRAGLQRQRGQLQENGKSVGRTTPLPANTSPAMSPPVYFPAAVVYS